VIFRRRSASAPSAADSSVAASPDDPGSPTEVIDPATDDEWAALDASRDWREDGPFDITEVDLAADDVERIDVGAVIVTPEPGLRIQLVVDQATQQSDTLLVAGEGFALQLNVLAAPAESGYMAEWRERVVEETTGSGGSVALAEGPFGTELRRLVPVTDQAGQTSQLPVRDWLVEGPRWLLHVRLTGQAADDTAGRGPAAQLEEFCRNLIIRRDETARVPGTPVPLRPPEPK